MDSEWDLLSTTLYILLKLFQKWGNLLHTLGEFDASMYLLFLCTFANSTNQSLLPRTLTLMLPESAGPCPLQKSLAYPRLTLQLSQNQWLMIIQLVCFHFIDSYISKLSSIDVLKWWWWSWRIVGCRLYIHSMECVYQSVEMQII